MRRRNTLSVKTPQEINKMTEAYWNETVAPGLDFEQDDVIDIDILIAFICFHCCTAMRRGYEIGVADAMQTINDG